LTTNLNLHRVNPQGVFLTKIYIKPPSFDRPNWKPGTTLPFTSQMQLDREALITARESLMAELKALKEAPENNWLFPKIGVPQNGW